MMFFLRFGYFGNLIEDIFKKKEEKLQEAQEEINESLMVNPNIPEEREGQI